MEKCLLVTGMKCPHCEAHMKQALEKLDGVTDATCDHVKGEVHVRLSRDVPDDVFQACVTQTGYEYHGVKAQ